VAGEVINPAPSTWQAYLSHGRSIVGVTIPCPNGYKGVTVAMNLWFGWIAILAGFLLGAVLGLFFYDQQWLGGYASWRRRMLRLSHISLVGVGLLNIAYALSVEQLQMEPSPRLASVLFLVAGVTMPTVCALASWHASFRHLFFVPVVSFVMAVADFLVQGFRT